MTQIDRNRPGIDSDQREFGREIDVGEVDQIVLEVVTKFGIGVHLYNIYIFFLVVHEFMDLHKLDLWLTLTF